MTWSDPRKAVWFYDPDTFTYHFTPNVTTAAEEGRGADMHISAIVHVAGDGTLAGITLPNLNWVHPPAPGYSGACANPDEPRLTFLTPLPDASMSIHAAADDKKPRSGSIRDGVKSLTVEARRLLMRALYG